MGAVTLDDWLARYGPLWPQHALQLTFEICAVVSRMPDSQLGRTIGSLTTKGIERTPVRGWEWRAREGAAQSAPVTDRDIVNRIGAILFQSVTARPLSYPIASDEGLRATLRHLRPDLSPHIAEVILMALSTTRPEAATLGGFAREVTRGLGVAAAPPGRVPVSRWLGVAAAGTIAIAIWLSNGSSAGATRLGHGLTSQDTAMLDVFTESAETWALIDEHTAALQVYGLITSLWQPNVPLDDARLARVDTYTSWVRALANDRLTAEQSLRAAPSRLAVQLRDDHPYVRGARLFLAFILDARGAQAEAEALRREADRLTGRLLHGTKRREDLSPAVAVGPGTVAHAAPVPPEREGFRRASDGRYLAPLTTMQRWFAEHAGWRLHVVTRGACRASVDVGDYPRSIGVAVSRAGDSRWKIRVEGVTPAAVLHAVAAEQIGLSLIGDKEGHVQVRIDDLPPVDRHIDARAAAPAPPYALSFDGACGLVWLEIPFPVRAEDSPF